MAKYEAYEIYLADSRAMAGLNHNLVCAWRVIKMIILQTCVTHLRQRLPQWL